LLILRAKNQPSAWLSPTANVINENFALSTERLKYSKWESRERAIGRHRRQQIRQYSAAVPADCHAAILQPVARPMRAFARFFFERVANSEFDLAAKPNVELSEAAALRRSESFFS
jgi:hypothetical protein